MGRGDYHYMKRIREQRRIAGVCLNCGEPKIKVTRLYCTSCLDLANKRTLACNARHKQKRLFANVDSRLKKKEKLAGRPRPHLCECCGDSAPRINYDHCHKTEAFRGWICTRCNLTLGHAQESIERLEKLVEYLKRVPNSR